MTHERWGPQIHYCQHHHMVRNPKTFRWKTVPADFIAELQEAQLPVALVARDCPGCRAEVAADAPTSSPWAPAPGIAPASHPAGSTL